MNKVTLTIDGMMCGMCEAHVCDALRKTCDPSAKVTASHVTGQAEVILEGQPDVARMKVALKELGYKVLNLQVEPYQKKKKGFLFFK